MIDMNQILSKVMGAAGNFADPAQTASGAGQMARQRIYPAAQQQSGGGLLDQLGALGVGAAAGGLAGSLLGSKKVRQMAGTVLQVGAVAAVGGLAFKAYQNYRQGRPVVPQQITDLLPSNTRAATQVAHQPAAPEAWVPPRQQSGEAATLILQAMIAAAAADGELDKFEYQRIQDRLRASGFSGEEQLLLSQLMMRPATIEQLAASATTTAQRVEVYTAARLAIDSDTPAEHEWLGKLANALQIEPGLKAHLDAIQTTEQAVAA